MTKIQAMVQLITDNGGIADCDTIYSNIEKYYPSAKNSDKWQEGLRGVLYRGIKDGFVKKLDVGLFSLPQYNAVSTQQMI